MLEEGIDKKEILKSLEQKLSKDLSYDSGFILGSMCTEPLAIGKELFTRYIDKNLGDPGLFKGTAQLERELIAEIGELFGGKSVVGTITTGGSEANIIAMRIAKKLRPDIKNPEVVVPITSHISFDKAADLLGVKLKKANLDKNFQLDLNHFESLINNNTCAVVGVAGTTSLGLVDPITEIGKLIDGKRIFFHVDAAFGGFVLPFLKDLSIKVPSWDFSIKSIDSITADPHKMGLGVIPSGGIFIRESTILQKTGFEIPYLSGGNFKHFNLVGTRSGGTVIAFWAILRNLGKNGFVKMIKECMNNTFYLAKRISEMEGIKLAVEPLMNVLGITTDNGESICNVEKELRKRNWMLGKFLNFNLIRIVIMPHVKRAHLLRFLNDLEKVLKITKAN